MSACRGSGDGDAGHGESQAADVEGAARSDQQSAGSRAGAATYAELYGLDGWSSVEFGQRMALRKQPLSQWLHGYYSSHAKPFPVKIETLHRLCGSQNSTLKGFKQKLISALNKLEEITHWSWEIDASDLVRLSKVPTASQSRHLLKQASFKVKKVRE